MGEGSNELYNKQDELQATGINSGVEHSSDIEKNDFSDVEEVLPGYSGNNTELLNDFLKSNPDLKGLLNDFLKNENIALKDKILCKKNIRNCKTVDDIKSIIVALTPGGYKIGKKEEVEKVVDKKGIDSKQAEEDEQTAEQEEKIKEAKKQLDETIKLREDLLQGHQDVDKETRKQAELVKQKLPDETKNQLKQRGYNDSDIDNYILVKVTLNEIKGNKDFDQKKVELFENSVKKLNTLDVFFKNLDNACNIPDTNLNSFSSKNITRTRHEFFNSNIGNQDLIETKKSNLKSRDYSEMINEEMSEKDVVQTYGKFLPDNFKDVLNKYNNNENLSDQELSFLIRGCENVKTQVDNKTKDMVEELCIISQIKGMYMCMGEGADFQMNKANEIESKDGILTLKGHIDGIAFSIRQDTNKPDARLQTSTRLRKKDNAFEIGNHFEDSNFILPSQSEVFNLAVKSVNSDGALQEAETPADYVSKLQDKIMSKMDDMYEDTKYANHYMHEQVKGEQIMDKSLSLVKNIKKSEIPTPITESNKGLFDFVGLIHFNIENSTSLEKTKLDSCLTKIHTIVDEYKKNNNTDNNADKDADKDTDKDADTNKVPEPGKYPLIIEHYLTDKTILKNTENLLTGKAVEGESLFDLFNQYKDTSDQRSDGKFGMINLASLENDLIPRNQSHSLIAKEFVATQEKNLADDYLAKNITAFAVA